MDKLDTVHPDLKELFIELIKYVDVKIIYGHRGKKEQNDLLRQSRSTKKYPDSKHNSTPSMAVDFAPYPIDWVDERRFYFVAGLLWGLAEGLGLKIRLGADWDGDGNIKNQNFNDLGHIELLNG